VKESPGDPAYGRTNWRRFAVSIGVPLAVAAGLVIALEQGALAASFQISGSDFKLSASNLDGTGFTQYSGALPSATNAQLQGNKVEALSGIKDAYITDLCQTVAAKNLPIPVVMRIDAGNAKPATDDTKVHATGLLIGMTDLQGDATFTNIQIGVADGSLDQDGSTAPHGSDPAGFGQQAEKVNIDHLRQTAQYTSAGSFRLTGMKLHLYVGGDASSHECFGDS
jgi:hypothetical protein